MIAAIPPQASKLYNSEKQIRDMNQHVDDLRDFTYAFARNEVNQFMFEYFGI